ncbi:MAG: RNA-guided endonuclease InsQ/TnpB family protein [Solirubrobacteraceae bacterium]
MLAYRYRLAPTGDQAGALERWCGCARAIYNAGLEQRQVAYRDFGVSLSYNDQGATELTEAKQALPWLAEPHSDVLQQALRDLDRAYRNFFNGAGFPRFKRKGQRDSFRVQARAGAPIRVRRLNRRWGEVIVPKLGAVRFRWSRKPVGDIHHVTISRDALGWHICLCCEQPDHVPAPHVGAPVGIDRGVAATVALSTGELLACPTLPAGQAQRERRLARKAGRQETARRHRPSDQRRRSRRHQRTLDALAKLKARETRIRKDFLHKLSTDLAKNHGLVAIEDLRVANMTRSAKGSIQQPGINVAQKRGLNRAILRQGWGDLERMLDYKTAAAGGTLVKVPASYTSQTCSACGVVDSESRRSQAVFACVACGHHANADINAARNILAAGQVVTARGADGEEAAAANREPPEGLADAA